MTTRRRFCARLSHTGLGLGLGVAALPALSAGVRDTDAWSETSIQPKRPEDAGQRVVLAEGDTAELFLGFGFSKESPEQQDWDRYLTILRLDTNPVQLSRIAVKHSIHGIIAVPDRPEQIVALQKRGHGGALISLTEGEVIQPLEKPANRQFYGHGSFSVTGDLFFNTETDLAEEYRGALVVRDSKSLRIIDSLPTYGAAPHDCRLIDGGKVLAVTNGGGPISTSSQAYHRPNIAYIELASGRLLEKFEFDNAHLNAGHLQVSAAGDLVAVSSFRDGLEATPDITGGISIKPQGKPFRTLNQPAELVTKLFGETLSTVIHEQSQTFATTTPQGDTLAFWNLKSGILQRAEWLPQPKGVELREDGSAYVVSYTHRGRALLGQWSTETLNRLPQHDLIDIYISGSHLVRHSLSNKSTS